MLIATNGLQTPITEELLDRLDSRSRVDFMDSLERITFIQRLISENREYARDKKRDSKGRIIVDLENLHILEDMDYFRERAIHYQKHGVYTHIYPNRAPNSEYRKFWDEERRRCREGYVRESDGEWIPGYYYYYLNYSPIDIVVEDDVIDAHLDDLEANVRASRIEDFPHIWDGDYFFFHYIERAEARGKHGTVLKCRGRGYSFKAAAMLARNYFLIKKSKSFAFASEQEYLLKDGLLTKTWANLNYIDNHTPWSQPRDYADREIHKRASYRDLESKTEKGFMSEIIGVTCKNDPQKGRGKRGKLLVFEESGTFPGLKQTFNIARKSMEQGRSTFGLELTMGTGGCVCAGTKVWTNRGVLVNIEDLVPDLGIIGFDQNSYSKEIITYFQPPTEKECVEIITNTKRKLRCSSDHPILKIEWLKDRTLAPIFKEAVSIKVGDKIAVLDELPLFGSKKMWSPRLVGLLIGDGSYGKDSTPVLANADKNIIDYVEDNFLCKTYTERETKDGRVYKEIGIKEICPNLRALGIYGQTKLLKTLPPNIDEYCKEDLAEMLGGLFDADGYINIRKNKSRDTYIMEISISSASDSLLEEIRMLLQKFGIHGRLRERKPRKSNPKDRNSWYEFTITDRRSLLKYHENIRFLVSFKQERLDRIKEECLKIRTLQKEGTGYRIESIISMKSIGKQPIYNLTAENTNTYVANGIITHNTKGADFEAAEEFFYHPNGYNILSLKNIFDKDAPNSECGLFIPEYLNRQGCYDNNGNSDVIKALIEIFIARQLVRNNSSDPNSLVQEKAESPITPQESVLRVEGNKFPVMDLKELLAGISANIDGFVKGHYTGNFTIGSQGKVDFRFNTDARPIREFPLKDIYKEGAVEIFEMPKPVSDSFRYILGADVFDDDDVKYSTSLGSAIVFDRWTRRIVAEYTGRPQTASEFYEIVYRMSRFYNAMIMYENNKKGLFAYFQLVKKDISILADTPEYLSDKSSLKPSYGNTAKGINATERINTMGRNLQVTWMLQNAYTDTPIEEGEVSKLNLHTIRSIGYIKECIAWNIDINADRVSAMNMVMLFDAELSQYEDGVTREKAQTRADDPFFKKVYKTSRPDTETGLLERITPMTSFGYRGMKKGLISN